MSGVVIGYDADGRMINMAVCDDSAAQTTEFEGYGLTVLVIPDRRDLPDPSSEYVSGGALTARPDQATAVSGTNLINLPIPAWVTIGEDRYEVTDGTAELSFPIPGKYGVKVEAYPYKDWYGEITA